MSEDTPGRKERRERGTRLTRSSLALPKKTSSVMEAGDTEDDDPVPPVE